MCVLDLRDDFYPPSLLSPCLLSLCRLSFFSPLDLAKLWCLCPRSVVSLRLVRSSPLKNIIDTHAVYFFTFANDEAEAFSLGNNTKGKGAHSPQE